LVPNKKILIYKMLKKFIVRVKKK